MAENPEFSKNIASTNYILQKFKDEKFSRNSYTKLYMKSWKIYKCLFDQYYLWSWYVGIWICNAIIICVPSIWPYHTSAWGIIWRVGTFIYWFDYFIFSEIEFWKLGFGFHNSPPYTYNNCYSALWVSRFCPYILNNSLNEQLIKSS